MTIDVSEAIDTDTSDLLPVIRTASGDYVDGLYIKGAEQAPFNANISIQNPTPKEVQMLPVGERTKDIKKFIASIELLIDNDRINQLADHVVYRGARYKIIKASDYQSYGYTRAFGARI